MNQQENENRTSTQDTPSTDEAVTVDQLTMSHKKWLKSIIGLGALEAKIWMTSGAQLVALLSGAVFLLVTSWLLLIALIATAAWYAGLPLLGIVFTAFIVTLLGAFFLVYLIKRTLQRLDLTRTLDAIIPTDSEDD
ncbi:hypothetical protein MGA5115_00965 [Marinomonas gallaica]|uniref:Uncharacterized protein n=1 Tax=Marinomonas gallaica TaxID=1806667 RepID=A0A1C3JPE1_9GAMM|nr:hypothetical protein [Marinomonas gallaica]SBT16879.1 hypothetical protein MGA5115_00965 [Marinomonas gallaica]SBT22170.1 hypothetical protein MGA5116_02783 [Marinomonas gallaica]